MHGLVSRSNGSVKYFLPTRVFGVRGLDSSKHRTVV
jgi:hypothetical protein